MVYMELSNEQEKRKTACMTNQTNGSSMGIKNISTGAINTEEEKKN